MHLIFLGPSLSLEEARAIHPRAVIVGPARQGDIVSAVRRYQLTAIGLIDGVFRKSLSPWHKEILFALENGVRVLGSSSMGALRAAECKPWGAEPIGRIAHEYATGERVNDADVVLAHGDKTTGYRHLSVPMVNIEATLSALSAGHSAGALSRDMEAAARAMFYAERTWRAIFDAVNLPENDRSFILDNLVDQKAADARELLIAIQFPMGELLGKRVAENAKQGYGSVLHANDVLHSSEVGSVRAWQIARAGAWAKEQAGNMALAVEFAKRLGLDRELPKVAFDAERARALDLTSDEYEKVVCEEMMLTRARQWLSSTDCGHGDAPRINGLLRSIGLYEQTKLQAAKELYG